MHEEVLWGRFSFLILQTIVDSFLNVFWEERNLNRAYLLLAGGKVQWIWKWNMAFDLISLGKNIVFLDHFHKLSLLLCVFQPFLWFLVQFKYLIVFLLSGILSTKELSVMLKVSMSDEVMKLRQLTILTLSFLFFHLSFFCCFLKSKPWSHSMGFLNNLISWSFLASEWWLPWAHKLPVEPFKNVLVKINVRFV